MRLFFEAALERGTVATSAKVALIVGSILALINYGDRIPLHADRVSMTPDCGSMLTRRL